MLFTSLRSHAIGALAVTGLLAGSGGAVVGQTDAPRWREDLKLFATELPRLHRNLFDRMTREKHTNELFVGEPTGGHPNHDTDTGRLVLPNSGLRISYSPFFWDYSFPGDKRVWIAPHLAVDLSSDDYVNGPDPVFDAVVRYAPEKTPADLLTDTDATCTAFVPA